MTVLSRQSKFNVILIKILMFFFTELNNSLKSMWDDERPYIAKQSLEIKAGASHILVSKYITRCNNQTIWHCYKNRQRSIGTEAQEINPHLHGPINFTTKQELHNGFWGKVDKRQDKKCGEDVDKREIFVHCWWEWKLVQPLWK